MNPKLLKSLNNCKDHTQVVNFMVAAKARLIADRDQTERNTKRQRQQLDDAVDQKREQIKNVKMGLPSEKNRMKVSAPDKARKHKQILDLEKSIEDLKLKKSKL